ncbi:MAG: starch synthase [Candidatus Harrisonbacteria bacterium CG10_big_fil_rev_8_21_14_0_10_42_17]|uniref:Glycogen synthase n=1 Tax=Candidatus Harrisonbacteria bacterium CG10_big_fil_rev_8_21_14_0_10_42_17 TaxID=1974584 RepID=A0A2M6WIC8_9BACT|nr:MAG: starch synthase [Candidatus Harrisonbacteria bacterium CG10_big_fil_rev_8_21_14_0_10_42_17]
MSILKGKLTRFPKKGLQKILFVAPEAAPFSKAGGLGEVMFALPRALAEIGFDVRVMIPRYAGIDLETFNLTMEHEGLAVPTGAENEEDIQHLICNVRKYTTNTLTEGMPVTAFFLENAEYYEKRSNIYGYSDDAIRWALLSRGTLEFLKVSEWIPDVIVSADWQTGFLPNDLKFLYKHDERLSKIATIFSIHNLSYQGMFDHHFVSEMDLDDGHSAIPYFFDERLLKVNGMRRGILHADMINTVSPTYAQEIMTKEYGELLDGLLRERRTRVYGIMNGIDYENFNPKTDEFIPKNFDAQSIEQRKENKKELQARFGLEQNPESFVIGITSRLTGQKGFDLLMQTADDLLKEMNIQFIIQGSGDSHFMSYFKELEKRFLGQVGTNLQFDRIMPKVVFAGSDAILIPSRFEPSGLVQLEAMHFGAVPIVRKTGGLADTVEDFNQQENMGTGFVFKEFNATAMMIAIIRAYDAYNNKRIWNGIIKRGMEKDFSWNHAAKEYGHLFNVVLGIHGEEGVENGSGNGSGN